MFDDYDTLRSKVKGFLCFGYPLSHKSQVRRSERHYTIQCVARNIYTEK